MDKQDIKNSYSEKVQCVTHNETTEQNLMAVIKYVLINSIHSSVAQDVTAHWIPLIFDIIALLFESVLMAICR